MAGSAALAPEPNAEVFSWLKSLPLAPEYRPSLAEFQDPISYIFKIEKEASKYGICKIVPPVPPSSKKTAIANFNRSLAARAASSDSSNSKSQPTFTTRQQQIGFCPRKQRPVQRPVWQSGEYYTFQEFEAKAKAFEKNYLKKWAKKGGLSPLEIETLYWKATVDKPFSVEYANDMPGSAFVPVNGRKYREAGEGLTLAETAWNMRGVSRTNGSLLKFMKEEIPGVTSPMVYVAMLFSWFAWHVEDHDLHSLNYLHMGAGKTWYGVPRDAAVAFEEVVRVHGYGGEINPLVTFAVLGEKTTVMSPEVFLSAGVPCCRLVQNAGEFVVTFPRAYHTGFSHGFNCGEAANIATPEWLRVAKDAAIRRASINYPPMVSHFQLLYDLALALCSRIPGGISSEPRSSRLRDKRKSEGEIVIKELFVQDVLQNNDLLHGLGKGSSIVLLPRSSSDISVCSKLRVGSQQFKVNPGYSPGACNSEGVNSSKGFVSEDLVFSRTTQMKGFYSVKEKFASLCERNRLSSLSANDNICSSSSVPLQRDTERETSQGDGLSDQRLFSCVTCGILSFACVAIVQPREPAARYLMSADCSFFNDWVVGSGVSFNKFTHVQGDATTEKNIFAGWKVEKAPDYDIPVQSVGYQIQAEDQSHEEALCTKGRKETSALGLLASAYGNSSDSEEDHVDSDIAVHHNESNIMNCPSGSVSQNMSCLPSHFEDCKASAVRVHDDHGQKANSEGRGTTSGTAFKNTSCTLNYSQDVCEAETSMLRNTGCPVDNRSGSLLPHSDEDSSRLHVFCLEHAAEVEQQLHPIGGADILLLCHPDYPKVEAEAKIVAEELGIDGIWKNLAYRNATPEDEERIQSALDSEEAIPGNGDWAVKLGINLFYSANLSRSPLYSKQMPYNSVIYYAFGRSSLAGSPTEPKVYQRRASKQKKVVAGKWCGKVWMSNQVHPLLAKRDSEDDDEKILHGWSLPDTKIERSESTHTDNFTTRKSAKKRKMTVESRKARKASFTGREYVSDNSIEEKYNPQQKTYSRSKQAKYFERDDAASEEDYSPLQQYGKPTRKQAKYIDSDEVSDDSMDDNSHMQHGRNFKVRETKFSDSDVASDDTMGYDSDSQLRRGLSKKQIEDSERDGISEDSMGGSSLKRQRKNRKSKPAKYVAKDVISDDQMEDHFQKQQRRIPKSRQAKYLDGEDIMVSDDELEHHIHKQQRSKGRRTKYLAGEDITSDDLLEDHSGKCHRRFPKSRQGKCLVQEDVVSDDQLDDHFQKPRGTIPKSRHNKRKNRVTVDSSDNYSRLMHRTPKRKVKSMGEEDINSDDQMEDSSHQQRRRILRSQQSKLETQQESKQSNSCRVKEHASRPRKRGAQLLVKPKTSQKMKQPPRVQRNQPNNFRDFNLCSEEEEEGGPSTRLRKRVPKVEEPEAKPKEKVTQRKKVNNATALKVSKTKDEEAEYECDIDGCTMSFGSKQELLVHKRNICPVKGCGKKFFSHKYLVQHRRVHEDDRPLRCPWKGCKMTFKWAWARTEHIRVHTGARPYVCAEPGCGQTFRFVSDFSRHKRKTGHSAKKSR
ncbi:lysine-specific demethylase REF6 [Prosopis cineraria]|uniref:lysine-specific demethylase REF6 n=1 Tax=Prosopis cineraria TaxID=364024 RepID=UPI00241096E4|nr:lysine-specific demethylase REF6 [Prosopis cineraria]